MSGAGAVVVTLVDGRVLHGALDARTDAQRLWLRLETAGIQLASSFGWDQVSQVSLGHQVYAGRDFWPVAREQMAPAQAALAAATDVPADENISRKIEVLPSLPKLLAHRPARAKVKSLCIAAELAQWDADAQSDGLRVFVYPLSADGQLVAIRGELELNLLAEIDKVSFTPTFRELERARHLVRVSDFDRGPGVYQLPFRQFHPDINFEVGQQAVVHARLGIPGQGRFEAADGQVLLREFSQVREHRQLFLQERLFPAEHWNPTSLSVDHF